VGVMGEEGGVMLETGSRRKVGGEMGAKFVTLMAGAWVESARMMQIGARRGVGGVVVMRGDQSGMDFMRLPPLPTRFASTEYIPLTFLVHSHGEGWVVHSSGCQPSPHILSGITMSVLV